MGKTIVEQECAHVVNTWRKATAVGDTTKAYFQKLTNKARHEDGGAGAEGLGQRRRQSGPKLEAQRAAQRGPARPDAGGGGGTLWGVQGHLVEKHL